MTLTPTWLWRTPWYAYAVTYFFTLKHLMIMKKVKMTVVKVSDETKEGNFIHTLRTEPTEVEFMGTKLTSKGETFYVALKAPLAIDLTDEIDLDRFDVVERTEELESQKTGEMETFTFKWLFPKRVSTK